MTTTLKHQQLAIVLATLVGLTLGAAGCAEKISGPDATGTVTVNLDLKAGPAVSFLLTVAAADIDTIRIPMAATDSELVTVVNVPFGADRHFVVEGTDLTGAVLYRGEAISDVFAVQPLDLTIEMPPVAPMVYMIPHFSAVRIGNEFLITVCVNNLTGLQNMGFGLSLNGLQKGDKLNELAIIDSVSLDPSLVERGVVLSVGQEGSSDVFINLSVVEGTIVDEKGDACLVDIHCHTQDTWQDETIDLIPELFLENLNGIEIPLQDVHLDTARFRLFRDRVPESYLGTEGVDVGIAMVPLGGGETMLAGATIIFDPTNEGQDSFLYLAALDGALAPRFELLVPWPDVQATLGLASGADGFYAIGTNGQSGSEMLHVDDSGVEIWRENLGQSHFLADVESRPGGGAIVSGLFSNDGFHFYLAAFEPDGSFVAFEPTDFSSNDIYAAVVALDDTTFVAAGTKQPFSDPDQDLALGKYTLGRGFSTVFERLTPSIGDRVARDLLVAPDGGFLVVGQANSGPESPNDVLAVMHDVDGFQVWERTFEAQGEETGMAVTLSGDGGFVIAGTTAQFANGPTDIVVIKLSAAGDLIWQRVHGGEANEQARDIIRDGTGFLITGTSNGGPISGQDILMLRLDSEGR